MSLRKSRKRRAAGKAAKAMTLYKLATPVGGAIKAYTGARAAKGLAKRAPGRKPLAILAGVLGIAGVAAAVRKRGGGDDLGYGPPNESHPSHETLAPSKAAAGQAENGSGQAASGESAGAAGAESSSGESGGESSGAKSSGAKSSGGKSGAKSSGAAETAVKAGGSASAPVGVGSGESSGESDDDSSGGEAGGDAAAGEHSIASAGGDGPAAEAGGPPGDEAGTEDAAREEGAETTG